MQFPPKTIPRSTSKTFVTSRVYSTLQSLRVDKSVEPTVVDLIERMGTHPAAAFHHHAYPGGLLDHTGEVMHHARGMLAGQYSFANREKPKRILTLAALFHDAGKLEEYNPNCDQMETIVEGTGILVRKAFGHTYISTTYWNNFCMECEMAGTPIPNDIALAVTHCILSHHGRLEWGSPVEPQTFEAHALHYADMLSSRFPLNYTDPPAKGVGSTHVRFVRGDADPFAEEEAEDE